MGVDAGIAFRTHLASRLSVAVTFAWALAEPLESREPPRNSEPAADAGWRWQERGEIAFVRDDDVTVLEHQIPVDEHESRK